MGLVYDFFCLLYEIFMFSFLVFVKITKMGQILKRLIFVFRSSDHSFLSLESG